MKKRITALALAVLITFAVVGCAADTTPDTTSQNQTNNDGNQQNNQTPDTNNPGETGQPSPNQPTADRYWIAVSAGCHFSMSIASDNTLWAWGRNNFGQLGDGTTTDRFTPVQILDNVTAVSAGYGHTLAIRTDGSLWGWGNNEDGQLGQGANFQHSPVKLMDDVIFISASTHNYSAAIKSDGTLLVWGVPFHVNRIAISDAFTLEGVVAFSNPHVIKEDGSLWDLQITEEGSQNPAQIMENVTSVSTVVYSIDRYTTALTDGGNVWVWRDKPCNNNERHWMEHITPSMISGTVNVKYISHLAALDVDGNMWEIGYSESADELKLELSSIVLNNVVSVSRTPWNHTLAIRDDGHIWAWGDNDFGQLGIGESGRRSYREAPTRVAYDILNP
jgi:alpha-tubulin suppressor-like RCC1 family protein